MEIILVAYLIITCTLGTMLILFFIIGLIQGDEVITDKMEEFIGKDKRS